MSPEEACGERRWHLLEEIGGAFASGQLDDLVEGDAGGLGARLPAALAPQLRSIRRRYAIAVRIIRIGERCGVRKATRE